MKYLITGGSGFIGKNLLGLLQGFSQEVEVFDKRDGKDILTSIRQLSSAVKNADTVIHLAAIPAHRLSIKKPFKIVNNNTITTLRVADYCRKYDKNLVFTSSFSVYGNQPTPWKEDMPLKGTTPYAVSKIASEQLLQLYAELYGINIQIARLSNAFGPNEELHKPPQVLPTWFEKAKQGKEIKIYGEDTTRDFTYAWDIAMALFKLSQKKGFDTYNVCYGKEIKLVDVAKAITEKTKIEPLPAYEAARWYGDNSKIKQAIEWEPTKDVFQWIIEQKTRKVIP